MELVYLWVEEYKNIRNQGFNFSPRFECEFDGENLTITENEDYESIFPKNINITAIVGENGSGKSSIVEILQKITIFNPITCDNISNLNYVFIYSIDKKLTIFSNMDGLNYNDKNILKKYRDDLVFEKFDFLFYDASMPYNRFNKYDVASNNFIYTQDFNALKEYNFIDLDTFKISEKLLFLKNKKIEFDFFQPVNIDINLKKEKEIKRDFFMYDFHNNKRFPFDIRNLVDDIFSDELDIDESFSFNVFLSYCDVFEREEFKRNLEHIKKNKKNRLKNITNILDKFYLSNDFQRTLNSYDSIYAKKTLNEVKELCEITDISNIDIDKLLTYRDYIDIDLIDNRGRSFSSLSHGEKVNFAIQLYIMYFSSNFIYIFDEPDLSLHPQWQKKYLKTIIDCTTKFKRNVHLVATTHSPFILSDIPKENVIFLEKYKENDDEVKKDNQKEGNCKNATKDIKLKTFGANIHTLLSDGFFMSDGLMGEFAKSKIEEIKKFYELIKKCEKVINESEKTKNTIKNIYQGYEPKFRNIQKIIGEPFLQTIIKNYLDELEILFNGKKEFLDKEIERLQELRKDLK